MNNKQLQYAIALSKDLNFSLVAEKFGISQPALSKQISSLEKDLGVELFIRRKKHITLSPAGEFFFEEAEKLLKGEQALFRSMEGFKSGECGTLAIGISPFRALYLLPQICQKIKEKFPGIKIVLHEESSDRLRKKAAEEKFDFAIVNLPVDESVFDIFPIEQDKLVLAVPTSLLPLLPSTEDLSKISFEVLENLPFIVVSKKQEMRALFEKMCAVASVRPKIAMEVVGLTTAWAMARAGIGATLLPMQFVREMENDGSVRLFVPDCEMNVRRPAIIVHRGQYLSKYAKYAIELLKK